MSFFQNLNKKLANVKVLLLGSYHPEYISLLIDLKDYLIEKGMINTFICKDLFNNIEPLSNSERMGNFFTQIESEMKSSDFNIFFLNERKNESTLVELTSYVKSVDFERKSQQTLVLMPRYLDISMLIGLLEQQEVLAFQYDYSVDYFMYCFQFILNRLHLV